jgi:biopolymer transport protein ExbB
MTARNRTPQRSALGRWGRAVVVASVGWTAALCALPQAAMAQSLSELVATEVQQLTLERDALRAETERLQAQLRDENAAADARIRTTSAEVSALEVEVAELRETVSTALRDVTVPSDEPVVDDLEGLLRRAQEELIDHGIAVPPGAVEPATVARVFAEWIDFLRAESTVRVERTTFFDASGQQEPDGEVLRIGQVAALVRCDDGVGVAVLDREGNWIEIRHLPDASMSAVFEGQNVGPVPVRLFESGEDGVFQVLPGERTLMERAGLVGYPLMAVAIAGGLLALVKLVHLLLGARPSSRPPTPRTFAEWMAGASAAGRSLDAQWVARGVARRPAGAAALADAIELEAAADLERLDRGLGGLKVIAATAPLLGLLGTVSGMITTFDALNTRGTGDAQALSGGISEALVTTEIGLWIAIPAVLLHTALQAWASRRGQAAVRAVAVVVGALRQEAEAGAAQAPAASSAPAGAA